MLNKIENKNIYNLWYSDEYYFSHNESTYILFILVFITFFCNKKFLSSLMSSCYRTLTDDITFFSKVKLIYH